MSLTWKENTRTTYIMYTPTLPQPQFKEKPVCRSSLWRQKASTVLKIHFVVVICPTYHHKNPLKISNTERESIRIKQCLLQHILKGKKNTHARTQRTYSTFWTSPLFHFAMLCLCAMHFRLSALTAVKIALAWRKQNKVIGNNCRLLNDGIMLN